MFFRVTPASQVYWPHFYFQIDWYDPLCLALISFHIIVTLATFFTRNHGNFQVLLFLLLILLVYFSESINEFAAHNWRTFSRQQYFDSKGMFISIVFSVPILLNLMLMVVSRLFGFSFYSVLEVNARCFREHLGYSNEFTNNW